MKTTVLKAVDAAAREATVVAAANKLNEGGLVAFPTETVYGLACRADLAPAVNRLREIKGRAADKAFTVHLADREQLADYVSSLAGRVARFIHKAWPGPITVIIRESHPDQTPIVNRFPESPHLQDCLYYDNAVGLRCPDDAVATDILRRVNGPVLASSANIAGKPAPTSAADVLALDGMFDVLVDAGVTRYAKPSTIVRFQDHRLSIMREGVLDARIVEDLATTRVLFVCTGNTCRSPMAAGLARQMIADKLKCHSDDLVAHGIVVQSAGTSGGSGYATDFAVQTVAKYGVDLSEHRSVALTQQMAQQADYIIVMTKAHKNVVNDLLLVSNDRVKLLLDHEDLRDPLGGTQADYEQCAERIRAGLVDRIAEMNL